MKLFITFLLLLTPVLGLSVDEAFKHDGRHLIEEYSDYDVAHLEKMADSLLNGTVDTSLSIPDMLKLFIKTSRIAPNVKVRVDSTCRGTLGFYRAKDSSVVISNKITLKSTALYTLIHELAHSIQFNYGIYTCISTDKGLFTSSQAIIVNEIYADYIAVRFGCSPTVRQDPFILSRYIRHGLIPQKQSVAELSTLCAIFNEVGNKLANLKVSKKFY